ncbi:MAG: hypothetical protein ACP5MK_01255 [Candidatus Micrarchaeia archaeon]
MSNKSIINKYEIFLSDLKKVVKKEELDKEDLSKIQTAKVVAALSSNHSWRTYRFMHDGEEFDKEKISEEAKDAFESGWKEINEFDIEEVANLNVEEQKFSLWLYYAVDKELREEVRQSFNTLKELFVDGIEPIEKSEN